MFPMPPEVSFMRHTLAGCATLLMSRHIACRQLGPLLHVAAGLGNYNPHSGTVTVPSASASVCQKHYRAAVSPSRNNSPMYTHNMHCTSTCHAVWAVAMHAGIASTTAVTTYTPVLPVTRPRVRSLHIKRRRVHECTCACCR